jgi:glycosyltransferase involved in cell wall biosynthesis
MKSPLVSICIPVYNRPELIKRAIDSCLNQTYEHIEVVVVDDASTDATPEVIQSYAAKDKRVKYYRNEKNLGMVPNWLRTFELATGDYVQHLGSDDRLSRNFTEEKVRIFEKYPDVAFVNCGIRTYLDHSGKTPTFLNETNYSSGRYTTDYVLSHFYKKPAMISTACTVRRGDMLKNFSTTIPNQWGYDDMYAKYGKIMDNFVFLKILTKYRFMYFLDNAFYESLEHPANATKSFFGLTRGNIADHITFSHVDQVGFSYFYKNWAPRHLSGYRIFAGAEILAGTFFDLLLGRAKGSSTKAFSAFFSDYSTKEKILAFIMFPVRVIQRAVQWIARKASGTPAPQAAQRG